MNKAAKSYLFVPGNRQERFDKACASGADAVIIDLEDAVAPENKITARNEVKKWLCGGGQAIVRINAANTEWFKDDCEILFEKNLLGIMLPKAEDDAVISNLAKMKPEKCELLLLIETAKGLCRSEQLAQIPGVSRLAFGSVDFQLDCSIPNSTFALDYARSILVVSSAVGSLPPPIDGVTINLEDTEVIIKESEYGREMGFGGKLCIHPKQVLHVNQVFMPSEDEIIKAKRIMQAYEDSGTGDAASLDGKLLEKPIVAWAKRVLDIKE